MTMLNLIGGQKPNPVGKYRKLYMYEGEPRPAHVIADMRGEPRSSVVYRLKHGIDLDAPRYSTSFKAAKTPMRLSYDGELMTLTEIADATGYSVSQVLRRSDGVRFFPRGEPTDPYEAKPHMPVAYNEQYELDGIKDTLKGWAKRTGLNYHTLRDRLRLHSIPLVLALKAPVTTRGERLANAKTVAKMAVLFNKAADGTASAAQMDTGGQSQTFNDSCPTGLPRTNDDLVGAEP
jgi:hypothetical protein